MRKRRGAARLGGTLMGIRGSPNSRSPGVEKGARMTSLYQRTRRYVEDQSGQVNYIIYVLVVVILIIILLRLL